MRKSTLGLAVVLSCLSALTVAGCNGGVSSASANPPPAITITLSTPDGASEISQGQSVAIAANLLNDTSNKGVTWSMAGAGTLSDQTSTSVVFTAPASVSTVTLDTITATSVAQPSVTGRITVTIDPAVSSFKVVTTSLNVGTVGLPYACPIYVSAGTTPYTWGISSGSLPSWATLNAATGLISGTPDAAGTASFTVEVTDSETSPARVTQALTLTVAPRDSSNNAALKGQYAFRLQGFDDATGNQFAMLGSFNADGNGQITNGLEDINGPGGYQPEVSFTGTYSVGTDNRGIASLVDSSGATVTFTIAVGTFNGSNVATKGSLIRFDDMDGATGKRGSGSLFLQDPSAFSLAHINGPYAFLFAGQTAKKGSRLALAGVYAADGNGNVTSGQADTNTDGSMSGQAFTGTVATTANTASFGRVIHNPAGIPLHFVHYIVGDERALAMSTDPESSSGLVVGEVLAQRSTPYSAASLKGTSVGYGVGKLTVSMGLWTFDGLGTASYSLIWGDDQSDTYGPQTGSLNYAAVANGRVTADGGSVAPGVPGAPILYLVDANEGFIMSTDASVSTGFFEPQAQGSVGPGAPGFHMVNSNEGLAPSTDASASAGFFKLQTDGTYSNASLWGNYFFGTVPPAADGGVTSGVGTSGGEGQLTITFDWSVRYGLTTVHDFETGPAINPDGSGVLLGSYFDDPFYMISPGKFVVLDVGWPITIIMIFQK